MTAQPDVLDAESTRSLLDQLLSDAELYATTDAYRELMTFVVHLRNFAPFNTMLLHIQKPGLTYAASAADWRDRFGRRPKPGARPLLIMWPFGPVATVYDVLDTEGEPLPQDAEAFPARGDIDNAKLAEISQLLEKRGININSIDAGDGYAGSIKVLKRPSDPKGASLCKLALNRNHPTATRFATVAHELAHLFLGHFGWRGGGWHGGGWGAVDGGRRPLSAGWLHPGRGPEWRAECREGNTRGRRRRRLRRNCGPARQSR